MTIGARVSSSRKRAAEADAAFRTVKIARSVGPDRGRKAHDKERQVIEKTKTNNKKRRARSVSLRATALIFANSKCSSQMAYGLFLVHLKPFFLPGYLSGI